MRKRNCWTVLVALAPGAVVYVWFFGPGLLINMLVAAVAACGTESILMRLRGHDAVQALTDGSALVTAVLIAFALPPLLPWWIPAIAAACAIVRARQQCAA